MLAGVVSGAFLHSSVLVGISLVGAIVVALGIAYMNVKFGEENPAAALLEGSHFLQFHQMQATATKGESHSVELPSAQPTSSPLPLPGMRTNPGLPGEVESDT